MAIARSQQVIPSMPGLPLLGNLLDIRHKRLELLQRISSEGRDIVALRAGPVVFTLLNTPELVHAALVEHGHSLEKIHIGERFLGGKSLEGKSLFWREHEAHRRQRKLVAPAFHHERIITYADAMVDFAERLQHKWADGEMIDVAQEMTRLTWWIIGKTLFNVDVLSEIEELGQAMATVLHFLAMEASKFVHIPYTWPTAVHRRVHKAMDYLNTTMDQMIANHRAVNHCDDVLSLLLCQQDEDGNFMSDRQVRDEITTLFIAGHETAASALSWSWYLLSQHPRIYASLRTEIDSTLCGRSPRFDDLSKLPFTLQVLKEAMRLYPPAYNLFGRRTICDIDLKGYHFPKGAYLLISPYALHRRADYFPDPEIFDPTRFAPENEHLIHRHSYIPFGVGQRICIGSAFSQMESHLLLATLAQRVIFTFTSKQPVEPEPLVTLRPKGALMMQVQRRSHL